MTSDEQALLDEIAARPGDDAPRLVYADWLDDHGEPDRAELIRLQCRMADMDHLGNEWQRLEPLRERAEALLRKHRRRWLEVLPAWARKAEQGFDRGFPASLHLYG